MDMGSPQVGIKRKSRLAVFEHITEKPRRKKRKFRANRFDDSDESSLSENELVIDEAPNEIKMNLKTPQSIRLRDEPLNLKCEWSTCEEFYKSWGEFNSHLLEHTATEPGATCLWKDCGADCGSLLYLKQHVSYHGYLTKLKNIGNNVLERTNLPECKYEKCDKIVLQEDGYTCEWEYCSIYFDNLFDFCMHMEIHINANPRIANERKKEFIVCCWLNCYSKFSTKVKLAEHVRTHTHEKTMACPTCSSLFASKAKFIDHRKRQLSQHLQSYQCSQCLKLFPTERLLREHTRSHINHYKCTMCDMTLATPARLAEHVRYKHMNVKCFKCSECSKSFVTVHNLNAHKKIHTGEVEIDCEFCPYRCRSKAGMESHHRRHHNEPAAIYECHSCKKRLKRGQYLTHHLMKKHNYHWPSGHSRFRYRKDRDGIYRLQTVRYESLEVTEEMILSESMQSSNMIQTSLPGEKMYSLSVQPSDETSRMGEDKILIIITDVDESGNIVKSEEMKSGQAVEEVIIKDKKMTELPNLNESEDEDEPKIVYNSKM